MSAHTREVLNPSRPASLGLGAAAFALFVAISAGGCFEESYTRCTVKCNTGGGPACPTGMMCLADNFCHAPGETDSCTAGPMFTSITLTARENQTCAITDGKLRCWGNNQGLQLGFATPARVATPTAVDDGNWKRVSLGGYHGCGITELDELKCWGNQSDGQTGQGGGFDKAPSPVIASVGDGAWQEVSAGAQFTIAIRGGALISFGNNSVGQLGVVGPLFSDNPLLIDDTHVWRAVSAGDAHACAITDDDDLYCWGQGGSGQLGLGNNEVAPVPTQVAAGTKWLAVSAGGLHTCAIERETGSLNCWGDGGSGQIGSANISNVPVAILTSKSYTALGVGLYHTCVIDTQGELSCFGYNEHSGLGDGTRQSASVPQVVPPPADGVRYTNVVGGFGHTCAAANNGHIYCFGDNRDGACGTGEFSNQWVPKRVGAGTWDKVAVGSKHVCGLGRSDGTSGAPALYCWGDGMSGQLGLGDTADRSVPDEVAESMTTPTDVAAGARHSCVIEGGVSLSCFGGNDFGQLAQSQSGDVLMPSSVMGSYSKVAAGFGHTCAIKTDNTLWCWGWNASGQLGTGATTQIVATPVMVAVASWEAIALGADRSCGISASELFCWGANANGEVGIGSTTPTSFNTPQRVLDTTTGFTSVAVGTTSSGLATAILSGEVYTWGNNVNGDLGRDDPDTTTPGKLVIAEAASLSEVCAGDSHGCAVSSDGSLYCWGYNSDGQLGTDQSTDNKPRLVSTPPEVTKWVSVSCGGRTTCARDANDGLWCWGRGGEGQLGLGQTAINPTTPSLVSFDEP